METHLSDKSGGKRNGFKSLKLFLFTPLFFFKKSVSINTSSDNVIFLATAIL